MWGFAILSYVWWIAIASGGTIISALFFLMRAGLARLDQPDRRIDDAVRCGGGGHLSHPAPGPSLVFLLAVFLSEHHDALGAISKPAAVGFLGALHLCARLGPVLVFRADPGSCERARSREDAPRSSASMACSPVAFGARAGSGGTCGPPTGSWPRSWRRWWYRSTASSDSISPAPQRRDGTRPNSRHSLSAARCCRALPSCCCSDSVAAAAAA